jgi:hypothetical protein
VHRLPEEVVLDAPQPRHVHDSEEHLTQPSTPHHHQHNYPRHESTFAQKHAADMQEMQDMNNSLAAEMQDMRNSLSSLDNLSARRHARFMERTLMQPSTPHHHQRKNPRQDTAFTQLQAADMQEMQDMRNSLANLRNANARRHARFMDTTRCNFQDWRYQHGAAVGNNIDSNSHHHHYGSVNDELTAGFDRCNQRSSSSQSSQQQQRSWPSSTFSSRFCSRSSSSCHNSSSKLLQPQLQ